MNHVQGGTNNRMINVQSMYLALLINDLVQMEHVTSMGYVGQQQETNREHFSSQFTSR